MDNALIQLRERAMDESYSTAALLRICLILGAETGSELLREWAERELTSYADDDELPHYREVRFPLFIDSINPAWHRTGQLIGRNEIPRDLREYIPEALPFRQPIEEIESMASADDSTRIALPIFPAVMGEWNKKNDPFEQIVGLYYRPTNSALHGLVGVVRTTLVMMVADLTRETPLVLPTKNRMDTIVNVRIYGEGDHNELHVQNNSGVVGAGANSQQTQNQGLDVEALATLLDAVRDSLEEVDDDTRADVDQAVSDFENEITSSAPNEEAARSRGRALLRVCGQIGIAAVTTAANAAVNGGLGMIGLG